MKRFHPGQDPLLKVLLSFKRDFLALSQSDAEVFVDVAQHPGTTSAEIQKRLHVDQPHTSRVLSKLVQKGYLRRLADPKRVNRKKYFLTAARGMPKLREWLKQARLSLDSERQDGGQQAS